MQKNFKDLVLDRRTIRQFLPDPVTDEDICEIISTATHACNSGNEQHWQFIAIRSDDLKTQIAEIVRKKADQLLDEVAIKRSGDRPSYNPQDFYLQAPVVLAVATAEGAYQSKPDLLMLEAEYSEMEIGNLRCRGDLQTLGAVIQLILLAAWEMGLGGCWMTGPLFARTKLEQLLGIAGGDSLAALIPLGRPASIPSARGRKRVEDVLRFV
jgi:nitroreductase